MHYFWCIKKIVCRTLKVCGTTGGDLRRKKLCLWPSTRKEGGSEGIPGYLEIPLRGGVQPKSELFPGFQNDDFLLSPLLECSVFEWEDTLTWQSGQCRNAEGSRAALLIGPLCPGSYSPARVWEAYKRTTKGPALSWGHDSFAMK